MCFPCGTPLARRSPRRRTAGRLVLRGGETEGFCGKVEREIRVTREHGAGGRVAGGHALVRREVERREELEFAGEWRE